MAILKDKQLANGSNGNYWKVVEEQYNKCSLQCLWRVALYKDQAHSASKAPPLGIIKTYQYKASPEELAGNRTALAYSKIKAKAATPVPPLGSPNAAIEDYVLFDADLANGADV